MKDYFVPKLQWHKSSIWGALKSHLQSLISESIWVIGRHSKVRFWLDNWLGSPLIDSIHEMIDMDPPIKLVIGD